MESLDTEGKLALLGYAARHDLCGTAPLRTNRRNQRYRSVPPGLYPAVLPDGKLACLFKVLMTNVCANDCAYCQNRLGGRGREASFKPEEFARAFMQLRYRRLAHGLFSYVTDTTTLDTFTSRSSPALPGQPLRGHASSPIGLP
jgi:predicted DNA-binding helix-hairpin-helix protein